MKLNKLILPVVGLAALSAGTYLFANNNDYSFKDFGEIIKSTDKIELLTTADLDGDGDADVLIGIHGGFEYKIIAYENKIKQKK